MTTRASGVVVWLGAALGWGWWAPSPSPPNVKFSHQIHLKAGVRCTGCHAPAASSTVADDRNLPAERDCLACHDGQRQGRVDTAALGSLSTAPRTVRFNHQLHAALPNVAAALAAAIDRHEYLGDGKDLQPLLDTKDACLACHRALDHADQATKANLPRMADCLVCHDRIDPPASCGTCHTMPAAKLKPASHQAGFLERHVDSTAGIDKSDCRGCHGTRFQCQGCH